MKEQIINQVLEYIETLGEAMSNGAKYGFEVLVKQQIISGIVTTIISLLVIGILFVAFKFLYKRYTENKNDTWSDWGVGLGVGGFIILIGICFLLFLIGDSILHIVNPEYYAIQEILDAIGG